MWLVFGIAAAAFAFINLVKPGKHRETFRWASLSLTALTLCAFYADGAARVLKEDWGGLMDTMPTLSRALWILTILSIALNGVDLFKKATRDN
ncbi:hypothetical protein [Aedoeadaptatus urinae]|uniref:hypothetical protein n=1 Tax=Aedoeadaptatus urinae TaxID=1871017 RepID=UPI00097D0A0F|nr:hypothetical protein [Peptoniphilus urinae]